MKLMATDTQMITGESIPEFFGRYDELIRLGYRRSPQFPDQFFSSVQTGYWMAEMELTTQDYTLADLEGMPWDDLKGLANRLEVSAKSKQALIYAVSQKLGLAK